MKCYLCGKDIEDISKFCEHCGSKIENKEEIILVNTDFNKSKNQDTLDYISTNVEEYKQDQYEESNFNNLKEGENNIITDNLEGTTNTNEKIDELNKDIIEFKGLNYYHEETQPNEKNNKMSIPKRIVIGIIVLNILVLVFGVMYLRKINNPENIVLKFNEALLNKNYEELLEVATTIDTNIEINELNSNALFKLYNENNDIKEEIKEILKEDLLRLKNNMSIETNKMLSLVEYKHGLYSTYKVAIQDYDITLMANLNDVKVSGFEKEINLNNQYEEVILNNVLLGQYDVKATTIDESEIEYSSENTISTIDSNSVEFNFEFTELEILEPNLEVINIYVNDKVYNGSFIGGILRISPISYNTIVKIECKTPWGIILSSSYRVTDEVSYNMFDPQFKIDDDTKIYLTKMACEYYYNAFTAYNNRDIETLESMNYRNNIDQINYFLDDIDYMRESEYGHYESIYTISNLAADKFFILEDISEQEFVIYVEATVEENRTYYDSDNKIEDGNSTQDKDNVGYDITIKNIDGNWVVTNMSSNYFRDINEIYNYN